MNPLNPKESHDVITICDRLKKHGYNIYSFARGAIEGDTIREAHQTIDEIRGVGKKRPFFSAMLLSTAVLTLVT